MKHINFCNLKLRFKLLVHFYIFPSNKILFIAFARFNFNKCITCIDLLSRERTWLAKKLLISYGRGFGIVPRL